MHRIKLELLKGQENTQKIFLNLPRKLGFKALDTEMTSTWTPGPWIIRQMPKCSEH